MKEIQVRGGYVTTVSDEDYERLSAYKWNAVKVKGRVYVAHIPRPIYMHRLVVGGNSPLIDHKNGDTLDNRRENLRPADHKQNGANSRPRHGSRYKGIRRLLSGRWQAQIGGTRSGTYLGLGTYDTPEEAAHMYDREALRRYGEFARLNFPGATGRVGQRFHSNECGAAAQAEMVAADKAASA